MRIVRDDKGNYHKVVERNGQLILEPVPVKKFCVCRPDGTLKSVHETKYSKVIEEGIAPHHIDLEPGEECHEITDWPTIPANIPKTGVQHLKWIVDNHKMDTKDPQGKRKILKK